MKARILPFLEQTAAFNAPELLAGATCTSRTGRSTTLTINAFLCPSDANIPTFDQRRLAPVRLRRAIPNNLGRRRAASTAASSTARPTRWATPTWAAIVTLAAVTDGTSNTAIWSELVKGNDTATVTGPGQTYHGAPSADPTNLRLDARRPSRRWSPSCIDGHDRGLATTWGPAGSAQPIGDGGRLYPRPCPRTSPSCFFSGDGGNPSGVTYRNLFGPTSKHPGGANVGMLDGSVRFVKDTRQPRRPGGPSCTKAGGEVIDADSFLNPRHSTRPDPARVGVDRIR